MDWKIRVKHFADLLETNKSIGRARGQSLPQDISQRGGVNPAVRRSAALGFSQLQAHYRRKLTELVQKWQDKKINKPQVIKTSLSIINDYFNKSYRYGMLYQAGLKGTPKNLNLPDQQQRWLHNAVKEEHQYFKRFIDDFNNSRIHWLARIDMYVETLNSIRAAGQVSATPLASDEYYVLIDWIMDFDAEHCHDCQYIAERSPYTRDNLPTTPGSGATRCLFNCKCELNIRKVSKVEYERVLRSQIPKKTILSHLKRLRR